MIPPVPDSASDAALDEAVVLYHALVGRRADLLAWLSRHPELAARFAEHLGDEAHVQRWMAPLRVGAHEGDPKTLAYTPTTEAESNSTSLEFGDFEFQEELGRGGMGVVYKARHRVLNKIVALKTVLAAGFHSQRDVARLQFEAEAAARLDHPNIVPIYGAGEYQGMPFFSMRYVSGGTLSEGMEAQRGDLRKAAALLAKVSRAVHYAHQRGIVHRDLKPGNILLENGEPMVADFGLAKTVDASSGLSFSGAIVGTPAYMAPEQARGDKGLSTIADVYSLGAILYQMLTGRPPFRGETVYETLINVIDQAPVEPSALNPATPPDLEAICLKCLEKKAENRYASAAELADDLERYSRGESVSVRPRSVLSQLGRAIGGRREDIGPTTDSWWAFTARALITFSACHGAVFGLIAGGATMPWVWAILVVGFLLNAITRTRQILRARKFFPWERHMVVLWTGHLVCTFGLATAMLPFDPSAPAGDALNLYPPLAVLYALAMFVQGSISMGMHYPVALLYLALAISLRFSGSAAPLVFLAVHVPTQLILVWITLRKGMKPSIPVPAPR